MNSSEIKVGIIMGSQSDWPTMKLAAEVLESFNVPYESKILSAHRTPDLMYEYAKNSRTRGLKVIIAGAGGAAHLPGMVASLTSIPVLGVPIKSSTLNGMDSLLSIVQMPKGVPVGTLAIGDSGATNASLLAMKRAIKKLKKKPTLTLIDGNKLPEIKNYKLKSVIKGDQKIPSISAASIIAKVTRDKMITKLAKKFKGYKWDQNYGYGTKHHLKAIKDLGITNHHRKTFSPINKVK